MCSKIYQPINLSTYQPINLSTYTMHINFEFKAKLEDISAAEKILLQHGPLFIGEDHQVDTYFNVPNGRLKLREGTIEHALIFYERTDSAAAKQSKVTLFKHSPDAALKQALTQSLGVKVVIDKKRRIYFIDTVKFHFDIVKGEVINNEQL